MKKTITNQSIYSTCKKVTFLGILTAALILGGCKKNADLDLAESADLSNSKQTATTSGYIGSGWVEITATQESIQKIHLQNSVNVMTKSWSGGTTPWYIDANDVFSTSQNSNSTVGYSYNGTYKEHTFSMIKYPGKRSEIRIHDDYTTGSRQFEGYITLNSNVFADNAVFQIFGGTTDATLMQIRGNGSDGTLNVYENGNMSGVWGNRIIASGITNVRTRINVIHKQQTSSASGQILVYVNGALKYSFYENQNPTSVPANYLKYGNYGRGSADNARVNSVVKWSNVRLWKDGTN